VRWPSRICSGWLKVRWALRRLHLILAVEENVPFCDENRFALAAGEATDRRGG